MTPDAPTPHASAREGSARPGFFRQPCKPYRDHQIAFFLLALNFILPAFSYTFLPQVAMDQFLQVNSLLGGAPYDFPEAASRVWRYLAAANVMTLGFMCVLLMVNLRTLFPVLVPLVFMKMYAALCWLFGWLADPGAAFFGAAAVLDFATSGAFVFFAVRARRAIADVPDEQLVPRPVVLPGLLGGGRRAGE